MADRSLIFKLIGEDISASHAIKGVGTSAQEAEGHTSSFGAGLNVAMAVGATAVAGFAAKGISTFTEMGAQTRALQREIGGTAEDASRLDYAAKLSGVGADQFAKSVGFLSKNVDKNSTAFKDLGVASTDAQGHARSMADMLPDIADKFQAMPAGPEKTAAALALFGKSGLDMLPMLNKGSEGIKALEAESDKMGNTMSGKDVKASADLTKSQKEWHATLTNLQITIGRALTPALTELTNLVSKHAGIIGPLAGVILGIVVATKAWGLAQNLAGIATKAWTVAQWAFNVAMDANPIALIVIGIIALIAIIVICYNKFTWFRELVDAVWGGIKTAFTVAWDVIKAVFGWIMDQFVKVGEGFRSAWHVLETVWNGIKEVFNVGVKFIKEIFNDVAQPIKDVFQGLVESIRVIWDTVKHILSVPIKLFIDVVLNDGIIKAWNALTGWIPGLGGSAHIDPIKFDGFAAGGPVPGQGSGDTVPAWLTPGEFVTRKDIVSQQGMAAFAALNAGKATIVPRYAAGGFVGAMVSSGGNDALLNEIRGLRGDVRAVQQQTARVGRDSAAALNYVTGQSNVYARGM